MGTKNTCNDVRWWLLPSGVPPSSPVHILVLRTNRVDWVCDDGARNKRHVLRTTHRSASLTHHPDGAGCTSRAPSLVWPFHIVRFLCGHSEPRLPAAMQERLLSARHPSTRRPRRRFCSNAIGPTDSNWQSAHHICIFPSHPADITNPPEKEKRTVLTCLSYCRCLRRGHLVIRATESAAKCLIAIGK